MDGELDSVGSNKNNSRKGRRLPKKFTCRFCNRLFSTSHARNGHLQIHRRERDNENKANDLLEQKGGSGSWMMNSGDVAAQNNASIPEGVQTHVELSSPPQVQTWPQAGSPSSLSA
ncbi:uncharacterized protein LOC131068247 isoform X2 [Cryptomeria japonica]|uniref:uncharacterized protein LOC131068247 isoform X2 n=1 Tax=Cryptomeria japonica TaxID=3369 RepID=UPI0027DA0DE1|nr:uncharacterized protein LOC131068247 isoform X2 [Cryptomeria japonica]